MLKKSKALFVLHLSPPAHGAAKVGDFIAESLDIKDAFETKFIKIRSSATINDIGRVSLKKCLLFIGLYFQVMWSLIVFRPDKIYFTASISGIAFYRDLLISTLWKSYSNFFTVKVYYHYHTKGVNLFVSSSRTKLLLTKFFVRDTNLILLSHLLEKDFDKVRTENTVLFLPNGVKDFTSKESFKKNLSSKYSYQHTVKMLYISHMTKSKGYDQVLNLALDTKGMNIHYHFAGDWGGDEDQLFFKDFIQRYRLEDRVTYHGFVSAQEKKDLFGACHLLIYPTKNDAFPLTILESLSFGIPILAKAEGSIPDMIDEKSGIIVDAADQLTGALTQALLTLINQETAIYCRERFLENFNLKRFENNLIRILNE